MAGGIKLTMYLDMDEVICDFLGKLLREYNMRYNKNIKIEDIKSWSLEQYIGKEGIGLFKQPLFFSDLEPIPNAIETIRCLIEEGREIFIISSPVNEYCVFDKYKWVKKHMPFFPIGNLVLVGNKKDLLIQLNVEGNDILFDDCPAFLECFSGISICMDMPYNKEVKCNYRVKNWDEFKVIVDKLNPIHMKEEVVI
jgi:5'(3')-deoxyribonucleotidase